MLLATERSSDLRSAGRNVQIRYAAVRAFGAYPLVQTAQALREQAARQTLLHFIVPFNRLVQILYKNIYLLNKILINFHILHLIIFFFYIIFGILIF